MIINQILCCGCPFEKEWTKFCFVPGHFLGPQYLKYVNFVPFIERIFVQTLAKTVFDIINFLF